MEFIERHPGKPWDWSYISAYITMEVIEENQYILWDWNEVSRNSNITISFIEKTLTNHGIGVIYQ
jgi:hypothetical protein